MQNLKKLTCKRDFAAGVYLSEAQDTIHPPPLTHCEYTYSHKEDGEGGELNQREGDKCNSSQSWVENTNMTHFISRI